MIKDRYTISKEKVIYLYTYYYQKNIAGRLDISLHKKYSERNYYITTKIINSKISPEFIPLAFKKYDFYLRPSSSKYFYSPISKDSTGYIKFHELKEVIKIYAKIVEKDKIEEGYNWNKRVKLPEKDDKNLLEIIDGVIHYDSTMTNKCGAGCELYFQVKSESEKPSEITDNDLIHIYFNFKEEDKEEEEGEEKKEEEKDEQKKEIEKEEEKKEEEKKEEEKKEEEKKEEEEEENEERKKGEKENEEEKKEEGKKGEKEKEEEEEEEKNKGEKENENEGEGKEEGKKGEKEEKENEKEEKEEEQKEEERKNNDRHNVYNSSSDYVWLIILLFILAVIIIVLIVVFILSIELCIVVLAIISELFAFIVFDAVVEIVLKFDSRIVVGLLFGIVVTILVVDTLDCLIGI